MLEIAMPTIALVDDDRNILTSAIATYTDGASALDGFHTAPPNLVILDIKMPRMDGMETLRLLRAKPPKQRRRRTLKEVSHDLTRSCRPSHARGDAGNS